MWCSKCSADKAETEFHRSGNNIDHPIRKGKSWWCKLCVRAASMKWKENNRFRLKQVEGVRRLKCRYGLTMADKAQMLADQNNQCAICRIPFDDTCRPELDHCHISGKNRGWLCHACNVLLGQAKDSVDTLLRAVVYLQK